MAANGDLFDYVVDTRKARMVKIDATMPQVSDFPNFSQFALAKDVIKEAKPPNSNFSPFPSLIMIPTQRTVICNFLTALYLSAGLKPMILGPISCGKTATITSMLTEYGRNFPNFCKLGANFNSGVDQNNEKVERVCKSDPVRVLSSLTDRLKSTKANYGWDSLVNDIESVDKHAIKDRDSYSNSENKRHLRHHMAKKSLGTVYVSLNRGSTGLNVANTLFGALDQNMAGGVLHPQTGSHAIIFVDDLHMVALATDKLGTRETLRGLVDNHGGGTRKNICNTALGTSSMASFAPTIHNSIISDPCRALMPVEQHTLLRNSTLVAAASKSFPEMCTKMPQLSRHFSPIAMNSAGDDEIQHIFQQCIVNIFTRRGVYSALNLRERRTDDGMFSSDLTQCAPVIVDATCNFLNRMGIQINFLAIAKFLKGLTFIEPKVVTNRYVLARVWAHECIREFVDPMNRTIDRENAMFELADSAAYFNLKDVSLARLQFTLKNQSKTPLLFCDFHTIAGMWAVDKEEEKNVSDDEGEDGAEKIAAMPDRKMSNFSLTGTGRRTPTRQPDDVCAHAHAHINQFIYEEICSSTEAEEAMIPVLRNAGGRNRSGGATTRQDVRHSTVTIPNFGSGVGAGARAGGGGRRRRSSIILSDKNKNAVVMTTQNGYGKVAIRNHLENVILVSKNKWLKHWPMCSGKPLLLENTVEQVVALVRLLNMPAGHCVLSGRKGLGKRSAAYLASILTDNHVVVIQATTLSEEVILASRIINSVRGINWRACMREAILMCIGIDLVEKSYNKPRRTTLIVRSVDKLVPEAANCLNYLLTTGNVGNLLHEGEIVEILSLWIFQEETEQDNSSNGKGKYSNDKRMMVDGKLNPNFDINAYNRKKDKNRKEMELLYDDPRLKSTKTKISHLVLQNLTVFLCVDEHSRSSDANTHLFHSAGLLQFREWNLKELQAVSFRMLVQGHDDHHVDELVTSGNKLRGVTGSSHDMLLNHFNELSENNPDDKISSRLEDQTFSLLCEWMGVGARTICKLDSIAHAFAKENTIAALHINCPRHAYIKTLRLYRKLSRTAVKWSCMRVEKVKQRCVSCEASGERSERRAKRATPRATPTFTNISLKTQHRGNWRTSGRH